jgi:hypothetical protein
MEFAKKRKMIEVNKGLFLVRYAAAEDEAQPPKVEVFVDPTSQQDIDLVLHPDHKDAILWQPGSCLVVLAAAPGKLAVEVTSHRESGSTAATVKIEPLTQGEAGARQAQAKKPRGGAGPLHFGDFRVLGHIAGIGDVLVGSQEWLAGPSAPSRIEGISIDWPSRPDDLDIRYAVKLAKAQPPSGQMLTPGSFAGTRGRALPVVGVILEMSGAERPNCQFLAEAIFLGSPTMRVTGKRVVLAGPTGREPLVGLRVGIEEKGAQPQPTAAPSRPGRPSSRVRVFRSRSKQDQTEPS